MVYSTRPFVVSLTVCHLVFCFISPFSIAITSLGEERANLSAFRSFVRLVLVWIFRFPLPLGVWEGLRFVIVALPGLFSYFFWLIRISITGVCCWNTSYGPKTVLDICPDISWMNHVNIIHSSCTSQYTVLQISFFKMELIFSFLKMLLSGHSRDIS